MGKAREFLSKELDSIKDGLLKEFVEIALDNGPEYIWSAPASSTGKYHPPFARGTFGLIKHIKSAVQWGKDLLRYHNPDNIERMTDLVVSAILLHDIKKFGDDEDYEKLMNGTKSKVKYDHGKDGKIYILNILNTFDLACKYSSLNEKPKSPTANELYRLHSDVELIASAVESHMQQWGDKQPESFLDKVVSMADYCSSRNIGFEGFDR